MRPHLDVFRGRTCPLAQFGHSRDGKKGKVQIVVGLVCNAAGCLVAVEVFPGNTGDPTTLAPQLQKLRAQFHLQRMVLVGDRGLLTDARLRAELQPVPGLDWVSALRRPAIQHLVEAGALDLTRLAETDVLECTAPTYPQERLIACRNPLLALERARKRRPSSKRPSGSWTRLSRRPRAPHAGSRVRLLLPRGSRRYGIVLRWASTSRSRSPTRSCGIPAMRSASRRTRRSMGSMWSARVCLGRPSRPSGPSARIRVWRPWSAPSEPEDRGPLRPPDWAPVDRAGARSCLPLHVSVLRRVAHAPGAGPLLFDDDDKAAGEARQASVVAPAQRSPRAQRKTRTQRTDEGLPIHSFQTLLDDLATVTQNRIRFGASRTETTMLTTLRRCSSGLLTCYRCPSQCRQ